MSTDSHSAAITPIEYTIDCNDRIREVSANWRAFALENGGDAKVMEVLGDSLWDHIVDHHTQDLYSLLIDSVRLTESPVAFPYRCDSPSVKRYMAMNIEPRNDHSVHFCSETLCIEPLVPEISFAASSIYRIRDIHVCSNCRKVKVAKDWMEVTEAFRSGLATANRVHFRAIHRICPFCLRQMQQRVGEMVRATEARSSEIAELLARFRAELPSTPTAEIPTGAACD